MITLCAYKKCSFTYIVKNILQRYTMTLLTIEINCYVNLYIWAHVYFYTFQN